MDKDHTFWHDRFHQQVGWTANTRRYLFEQAGISANDSILETGCGSGALMDAIADDGFHRLTGIDIDFDTLSYAYVPFLNACADGLHLPFRAASFYHCLCHFYFMWVSNPLAAIKEMKRVTKPGGWVLALAESDYEGRVDFPREWGELGQMQTQGLREQGADTAMGRQLLSLFHACGLQDVRGGIISAEWRAGTAVEPFENDLSVLKRDLAGQMAPGEIERFLADAKKRGKDSGGIWYVPIFYACGKKPE